MAAIAFVLFVVTGPLADWMARSWAEDQGLEYPAVLLAGSTALGILGVLVLGLLLLLMILPRDRGEQGG